MTTPAARSAKPLRLDEPRFRHEYDLEALETIRPFGNDFEMLVTPRFRRIYLQPGYEAYMAKLVRAMARSSSLFVDIGAHYGFFSLLAASGNPELEVVACEPVPESHEVLTRNFLNNGLAGARALQVAASDRPGTGGLHVSLASDNCSFYPHPVAPPLRQIEVDTTTVDRLLAEREPCRTLVKVDTDGHELWVLDGMDETLARFPDLGLFVELNPTMQRLAGREPDELLAELDRRGFEVFLLNEAKRRPYRVRRGSDWQALMPSQASYVNLYCCRRARSLSVALFSHAAHLAGAERSLLELVSELVADHGALCTVVLPAEGPLRERLESAGAATVVTRYSWWGVAGDAAGAPPPGRDFTAWLEPSARTLLGDPLDELERIDPDVLVTHSVAIPWGAVLAPVLGKPHAWHLCEYVDPGVRFAVPIDEVGEIVRASSGVVFTACAGIGADLLGADADGLCRTLYRHIEIPVPSSGLPAPRAFRCPGAVRLAQLATQAPSKGQDLVVRAVARVVERGHDVELLLAGSGRDDFRAELATLVEDLGLGGIVRLEDFIEDVYDVIRQSDVVLVGSRSEAFCRVAVEAMLLGKPVVYPRIGGLVEYMRDGATGLGYDAGDVAGMAAAIEALATDAALRAELGRQGREHALATFTRDGFGGAAFRALLALRGTEVKAAPRWSALLARTAKRAREEAVLWRDRHAELTSAQQELAAAASAARLEAQELRTELAQAKGQERQAKVSRDVVLARTTWRIATWLRRPVELLLPPGTRRRARIKALVDRARLRVPRGRRR